MPRYSLKALLLVITVVAAMAAFYHIRSQPRIMSQRFQKLIEQGDHAAALQMIDRPSLNVQRKLEPHERMELLSFTDEHQTIAEWLQGKRRGSLEMEIIGTSKTASVITPVHCDVVITSTDVDVVRAEEAEPLVALIPDSDF
jgi:hypothetical protein